jgi:hypothetical protein
MERLEPTVEKSPKEAHARQPSSQQLLYNLTQGLQPVEVPLGNAIPPFGLGNGVATREHRERRVRVISQKKHTFHHPSRGTDVGRWK